MYTCYLLYSQCTVNRGMMFGVNKNNHAICSTLCASMLSVKHRWYLVSAKQIILFVQFNYFMLWSWENSIINIFELWVCIRTKSGRRLDKILWTHIMMVLPGSGIMHETILNSEKEWTEEEDCYKLFVVEVSCRSGGLIFIFLFNSLHKWHSSNLCIAKY